MRFPRLTIVAVLLALFALTGCEDHRNKADQQATRATEVLAQEAYAQTGMPGISNFTERKLLRQLYELRDQEISTFTYIREFNGGLFKLCNSIGFGMPFSAQYSSPEKLVHEFSQGRIAMPQPEPNGLYPPTSTSATFVICSDPNKGQFRPVYVEDPIIVSTFELNVVGGYAD